MSNAKIKEALVKARMDLIFNHPFFGVLAFHLKMVELEAPVEIVDFKGKKVASSNITFATDYKNLYYNPKLVEAWLADKSVGHARVVAAIAHEIMHNVMHHGLRQQKRHQMKWNYAADLAINPILKDCGFQVGEEWALDDKFRDMSSEAIYAKLPEPKTINITIGHGGSEGDGKKQKGQGQHICGGLFEVTDENGKPLSTAEKDQLEAEMNILIAQAAATAKNQGKLPGALKEFVDNILEPKVRWQDKLRRFMETVSQNDYNWNRPNRRHIQRGLYLPSLHSHDLNNLVVVIDTSGSISTQDLEQFAGELSDILEVVGAGTTHVVYCDAAVNKVETFTRNDLPLHLEVIGRGGTDFRPPFKWAEENSVDPVALIYLTDLYGSFPDEPDYPVMWATLGNANPEPPFGELIKID